MPRRGLVDLPHRLEGEELGAERGARYDAAPPFRSRVVAEFPALPVTSVAGAGVTEDGAHVLLIVEAAPGPLTLAIPVDQMPQLITVLANALEEADGRNGATS